MAENKEPVFSNEAWESYMRLTRERPEDFRQDERLAIILDRKTVEEYANRTGKRMGVVYSSPYHIMVVDLVRSPDGVCFAYERLLPAVPKGAVVTIPVKGNQYVLLKQFRHSMRGEQYAFPRGFAEDGLSIEENAAKELQEELGAHLLSAKTLGTLVADSGVAGNSVAVVLCEIDTVSLQKGYEGIQNVILLSEAELRKWILSGNINDGFTLSAFALLEAQKGIAS